MAKSIRPQAAIADISSRNVSRRRSSDKTKSFGGRARRGRRSGATEERGEQAREDSETPLIVRQNKTAVSGADVERCPVCQSAAIIKKGIRSKKHERVQLYWCKYCKRKFTAALTRFKTYPLRAVLDALTFYNRLHSLEETAERVKQCYGFAVRPETVRDWLADYREYLPFGRMREFIAKRYKPSEAVVETRLFHNQIYDFRYHRAKLACLLEDEFRNQKFAPLKDFLELALAECPHEVFRESGLRASEHKNVFNLDGVRIVPKTNAAVRTAAMVLSAVANRKLRHEVVQRFMLANDSVTVAAEVPVLLTPEDVRHLTHELNFTVPLDIEKPVTGHIDLLQVRNGMIHILDFKPNAKRARPVDQLMLYALALSRLTTLRLFHMKCAWFDGESYFEFFPLHVVYKRQKRIRRKVVAKALVQPV
ncbi:MAG: PD-(D/E)XK nuclease family protein [bacterium]|nr:PD-(D/E)XK nuclease family protein [bacterium]MDZ4296664.1 PD-(D/E)XK nuclease family protein [Patescibacteria group bacterium]